MTNFKLVNRIFAAVAFLFSFIIYLRTMAPTVSFWDCGEFITCSYILGIPHPPGAPLFLLIGRIFTMLPLSADIAFRVNVISGISSALSVMLTYLIIIRMIRKWRGNPKNSNDILVLVSSALLGALSFAFTDSFWFNAVESEVYAISMFFTSLIVWLSLVWLEKSDQPGAERYILIIAYIVGLAIGVHLLMILALPAIFMLAYFKYLDRNGLKMSFINVLVFLLITLAIFIAIYPGIVKWIPTLAGKTSIWMLFGLVFVLAFGVYFALTSERKILTLAMMSAFLVILGYSTYTMIYIRSGLDPVINENDPEDMHKMISYLNREQYGELQTFPRRFPGLTPEWQFQQEHPYENYTTYRMDKQWDHFWNYQIKKMYIRYFGWQFIGKGTTYGDDGFISEIISLNGLLGLPFIIGLIGMVHHFYRYWRHGLFVLMLFLLTGLAIIVYLNQENPQPRERDYSYVGSFFAFSIWIGMGLTAILEWIEEALRKIEMRKLLLIAVIILFSVLSPLNLLFSNYKEHDRTGNYVAYDYSYNILQTCESNAIVYTNGDNDTFPLWFLQYVYKVRPDVRVVNLSLLNTPWYIKQLKNQEPKVPISYRDEEIDQLEIIRWDTKSLSIPVPPKVREQALLDLGETKSLVNDDPERLDNLTIEVRPTVFGQALRVQDLMILNIIYANNWRKPTYFAVTVSDQNKVNLQKYLRMDGLGFELVPYEGRFISTEKLEKNLFEVFQYRGLNDPTVYLNYNIKGLLQNYRAAFLRLAHENLIRQNYDKVVKTLDYMDEVMPSQIIPAPDPRIYLQIGQYYDMAGRSDRFLHYAELAADMDPDSPLIIGSLVSLYSREGLHEKSIARLEEWLMKNPDDQEAIKKLEEERRLSAAMDTSLGFPASDAPDEQEQ